MSDLELKALECSLQVAADYPLLILSGRASAILPVLQKCYMEGFIEGMKHGHDIDMKVINDTLGNPVKT